MNRNQRRAGRSRQRSAAEAVSRANTLQRRGRLDQAEAIYRKVLKRFPGHADALHYLGVLQHRKGRSEEGIHLIRESIARQPASPDAHNNLGNVLGQIGRLEEAVQAYRDGLALAPGQVGMLRNLGVALSRLGHYEQACGTLHRVLEANPSHSLAWCDLGHAHRSAGHAQAAIEAYQRSVAHVNPAQPAQEIAVAFESLAHLLFVEGRREEAIGVLRQWCELDPHNPRVGHRLAAYQGETAPERAADDYVRDLFDQFAGSFDAALQKLDYRAPALVAAAVDRLWRPPRPGAILDAGCGTGLCADFLRPLAHRLTGVDLSTGMIEKARGRELYDELVVAELTGYLAGKAGRFDLVVSVDTLCYFGALDQVLGNAAHAMRPGGLLIFTLELLEPATAPAPYRLEPSGRYSHSERYVRDLLEQVGLGLVESQPGVLRREDGRAVDGMVVAARKA